MLHSNQKIYPEEVRSDSDNQLVEVRSQRHLRILYIDEHGNRCHDIGALLEKKHKKRDEGITTKTATITEDVTFEKATSCQDVSGFTNSTSCTVNFPKSDQHTGTVIFFLHGVGGCLEIWKSQIEFVLSSFQGCRVVAVDMLGHGQSLAPNDSSAYEFAEFAQDVVEMFDSFCGETNYVFGHSYGCSFAIFIASLRLNLVSKLVLISGGSPLPLSPEPGILRLPECFLICMRRPITGYFLSHLFFCRNDELAKDLVIPPMHVLKYTMMGQRWMQGDIELHSTINIDTLLIHGEKDSLITVAEVEQTKQATKGLKSQYERILIHHTRRQLGLAMKNAQLVIVKNAGHMVMMEKPDEVNEHLKLFLNRRD